MTTFVSRVGKPTGKFIANAAKNLSPQAAQRISSPLVTLVPVPRDFQQSVSSAPFDAKPDSHIMQYCHSLDQINQRGPNITNGIEIFGGAIGWQMYAMQGVNPMDVLRNFVKATPNGTPVVSLGRGQAGPALHDLHNNTLERFYRHVSNTVTEIDAKHNPHLKGREFQQRFFHFNDTRFQKEGTEAIQVKLHKEGVSNFRIIDSTVYTDDKPLDLIATRVVDAMVRELFRNGVQKGTYVEIKDFAGSMTPDKAAKLQELIAQKRDEKVAEHKENHAFAEALKDATVGWHIHRTHFSQNVGPVLIKGAKEHNLRTTIHCVSKVKNATHLPIEELIIPMKDIGISTTPEQERIIEESNRLLEKANQAHSHLLVVPGNPEHTPPQGDHLAGGGLPSRIKYADAIAKELKIPEDKALAKLEEGLHKHRTANTIALVTPALFNTTTLEYTSIMNQPKGLQRYANLPDGSIDTIRNLDPETVTDKELLEACYKQYREKVLTELVAKKDITKEVMDEVMKIGLNSTKTSLDNEATIVILQKAGIKQEIQDIIIESGMHLTRPHTLVDETIAAEKEVDKYAQQGKLKVPREDAIVLMSTLTQSGIGRNVAVNLQAKEETFQDKVKRNDLEAINNVRANLMDGDPILYSEIVTKHTFTEFASNRSQREVA